mgnify:FL=1
MIKQKDKNASRKKRHDRVRRKISGTLERPRFCVYRSLNHIYVQIINDQNGTTLAAASTLDPDLKEKVVGKTRKEAAKIVGEAAGKKAMEKGIHRVVFDRSGYVYHGRVLEVASGAREAGLEF